MRLLVSVRSVEEALVAARGGADFIDLKEPRAGALGGLPIATIRAIVSALREQEITLPVSATIGDLAMDSLPALMAQVQAVGACGVDYVKVGIEPVPEAGAVLDALASCGLPIVPVFLADRGIDFTQLAQACSLRFPGIMADTADKHAGSLFDVVSPAVLRRFVATVREAGLMVGLAGALRADDADRLQDLQADFAGFRTAVCQVDRSAALDPQRLRSLAAALQQPSTLLVSG